MPREPPLRAASEGESELPSDWEEEEASTDDGGHRNDGDGGVDEDDSDGDTRSALKDAYRLQLDGKEFPWGRAHFFLPPWIPAPIRANMKSRITYAGGNITQDAQSASIIMTYYDMTPEDRDALARLPGMSNKIRDREVLLACSDWLARVFFTDRAVSVPRRRKGRRGAFVRRRTQLYVAVADLGNEDLRDKTMLDLEMHGAIVVGAEEDYDVCILPDQHPLLARPPKGRIQYHDQKWVGDTIAAFRNPHRSNATRVDENTSMSQEAQHDPPAGPSRTQPTQPLSRNPSRTQRQPQSQRRSRPRTEPPRDPTQPPPLRGRTEFTPHDRERLARWLGFVRPTDAGRTTRSLYKRLEVYEPDDPVYSWATRHPWSAWHNHFKKNRTLLRPGDDMTLEQMVDAYARAGVDHTLRTAAEREQDGDEDESVQDEEERGQDEEESEQDEREQDEQESEQGGEQARAKGKRRAEDPDQRRAKRNKSGRGRLSTSESRHTTRQRANGSSSRADETKRAGNRRGSGESEQSSGPSARAQRLANRLKVAEDRSDAIEVDQVV